MLVRVICFGVLRERLGGGEMPLEMPEGAIAGDVVNVYKERVPGFGWESIAIAVNREYAQAEQRLEEGDEIALLPPVSGGSGNDDAC